MCEHYQLLESHERGYPATVIPTSMSLLEVPRR